MPAAETRVLMPPPPPGLYTRDEVSMADYLSADAVSAGLLKDVLHRGPVYAARSRLVVSPDTDATRLGTAVHMAVLEPEDFARRYARLSELASRDLRSSEARAEKAGIIAQGRVPLKAAEWETCVGLRDAAWANPTLAGLLSRCEPEATAIWQTDVGALVGKARADVLCEEAETIIDLKTTRDATPIEFGRQAASLGYALSSDWYLRGFGAAGAHVRYWCLAALEADPDVGHYDVRLYTLDPVTLIRAREKNRLALEEWAAAAAGGFQPYPRAYEPLPLPAWALE